MLCAKSIKNKIKEGDNFAIGLWARNKFGWDRPGRTIELSMPNANGDIGDDNKIIIELVRAPKREVETQIGLPSASREANSGQ